MVEHCIAVQRGELGRDQLASSQKILSKGKKASCSMMCTSFIWKTTHTYMFLYRKI